MASFRFLKWVSKGRSTAKLHRRISDLRKEARESGLEDNLDRYIRDVQDALENASEREALPLLIRAERLLDAFYMLFNMEIGNEKAIRDAKSALIDLGLQDLYDVLVKWSRPGGGLSLSQRGGYPYSTLIQRIVGDICGAGGSPLGPSQAEYGLQLLKSCCKLGIENTSLLAQLLRSLKCDKDPIQVIERLRQVPPLVTWIVIRNELEIRLADIPVEDCLELLERVDMLKDYDNTAMIDLCREIVDDSLPRWKALFDGFQKRSGVSKGLHDGLNELALHSKLPNDRWVACDLLNRITAENALSIEIRRDLVARDLNGEFIAFIEKALEEWAYVLGWKPQQILARAFTWKYKRFPDTIERLPVEQFMDLLHHMLCHGESDTSSRKEIAKIVEAYALSLGDVGVVDLLKVGASHENENVRIIVLGLRLSAAVYDPSSLPEDLLYIGLDEMSEENLNGYLRKLVSLAPTADTVVLEAVMARLRTFENRETDKERSGLTMDARRWMEGFVDSEAERYLELLKQIPRDDRDSSLREIAHVTRLSDYGIAMVGRDSVSVNESLERIWWEGGEEALAAECVFAAFGGHLDQLLHKLRELPEEAGTRYGALLRHHRILAGELRSLPADLLKEYCERMTSSDADPEMLDRIKNGLSGDTPLKASAADLRDLCEGEGLPVRVQRLIAIHLVASSDEALEWPLRRLVSLIGFDEAVIPELALRWLAHSVERLEDGFAWEDAVTYLPDQPPESAIEWLSKIITMRSEAMLTMALHPRYKSYIVALILRSNGNCLDSLPPVETLGVFAAVGSELVDDIRDRVINRTAKRLRDVSTVATLLDLDSSVLDSVLVSLTQIGAFDRTFQGGHPNAATARNFILVRDRICSQREINPSLLVRELLELSDNHLEPLEPLETQLNSPIYRAMFQAVMALRGDSEEHLAGDCLRTLFDRCHSEENRLSVLNVLKDLLFQRADVIYYLLQTNSPYWNELEREFLQRVIYSPRLILWSLNDDQIADLLRRFQSHDPETVQEAIHALAREDRIRAVEVDAKRSRYDCGALITLFPPELHGNEVAGLSQEAIDTLVHAHKEIFRKTLEPNERRKILRFFLDWIVTEPQQRLGFIQSMATRGTIPKELVGIVRLFSEQCTSADALLEGLFWLVGSSAEAQSCIEKAEAELAILNPDRFVSYLDIAMVTLTRPALKLLLERLVARAPERYVQALVWASGTTIDIMIKPEFVNVAVDKSAINPATLKKIDSIQKLDGADSRVRAAIIRLVKEVAEGPVRVRLAAADILPVFATSWLKRSTAELLRATAIPEHDLAGLDLSSFTKYLAAVAHGLEETKLGNDWRTDRLFKTFREKLSRATEAEIDLLDKGGLRAGIPSNQFGMIVQRLIEIRTLELLAQRWDLLEDSERDGLLRITSSFRWTPGRPEFLNALRDLVRGRVTVLCRIIRQGLPPESEEAASVIQLLSEVRDLQLNFLEIEPGDWKDLITRARVVLPSKTLNDIGASIVIRNGSDYRRALDLVDALIDGPVSGSILGVCIRFIAESCEDIDHEALKQRLLEVGRNAAFDPSNKSIKGGLQNLSRQLPTHFRKADGLFIRPSKQLAAWLSKKGVARPLVNSVKTALEQKGKKRSIR